MATQTPPPRLLRKAPGLLIDVGAPLVLFYLLRAFGINEVAALVVGMIPPAVNAVVTAIRQRSISTLGALMLAGMLISLVVGLVSGNPRELLVRNAWISAPLSLWTLGSLWARRPINFTVTREILPTRAPLMDHLWETDPGFRRAWRQITIMWGVLMLVDAGLRIFIAVVLPIDMVPVLDGVITAVTITALQVPTHLFMHRTGHWWEIFGPPDRYRPPHRRSSASAHEP